MDLLDAARYVAMDAQRFDPMRRIVSSFYHHYHHLLTRSFGSASPISSKIRGK